MKKVTAAKAYKIMKKLGLCFGEDGTTYYATNNEETEVYEFDTRKERDAFIERHADK